MEQGIRDGVRLFNSQRYFEAHEALEVAWLSATGDRKTFLHGLIQVAAAFHHHMEGNNAGFRSLLEKGCSKLESFGAEFEGISLAEFRPQLQAWHEHLHTPSPPASSAPELPQIKWTGKTEQG